MERKGWRDKRGGGEDNRLRQGDRARNLKWKKETKGAG